MSDHPKARFLARLDSGNQSCILSVSSPRRRLSNYKSCRSTNVPRTIESLQQVINGLYPNGKNLHRPHLLVRCVLSSLHHIGGSLSSACHDDARRSEILLACLHSPYLRVVHSLKSINSVLLNNAGTPKTRTSSQITSVASGWNGSPSRLRKVGCSQTEWIRVDSFTQLCNIAAAEKLNPSLTPLDKRLSKYLDGEPVRVDGKPRASGILDTVR